MVSSQTKLMELTMLHKVKLSAWSQKYYVKINEAKQWLAAMNKHHQLK